MREYGKISWYVGVGNFGEIGKMFTSAGGSKIILNSLQLPGPFSAVKLEEFVCPVLREGFQPFNTQLHLMMTTRAP